MTMTGDLETGYTIRGWYSSGVQASGGTTPYTFNIMSGALPPGFYIRQSGSNFYLEGIPNQAGTYKFTLRVTDRRDAYVEKEFSVTIKDSYTQANDMSVANLFESNHDVDKWYSSSVKVSGGTSPYTFSVLSGNLPDGLYIRQSGSDFYLEGTPKKAGTYDFALRFRDWRNTYVDGQYSVTINGTASSPTEADDMLIENVFASGLRINSSYYSSVYVKGGTGDCRVSLVEGELPSGLSLRISGSYICLEGIPNKAGTYNFTLRATDQREKYIERDFTVKINDTPTEADDMLITGDFVTDLRVNSSYSSYVSITGGASSYRISFVKGTLPPGLSLYLSYSSNNIYRLYLDGIPNKAGTYNFTLRVTDQREKYIERDFTVFFEGDSTTTPQKATDMMMTGNLPDGYTVASGGWYSNGVQVTGGTSPYTFNIVEGAIPPGFYIRQSGSNFYLNGIPNKAGTYNFKLRITDQRSMYVEKALSVIIHDKHYKASDMMMTGNLPDGYTVALGGWYSNGVQITGGTSPYTFNIVEGALPPGFYIRQSGSNFYLNGIPNTPGTYSFKIKVTDRRNAYVEKQLSVTIHGTSNNATVDTNNVAINAENFPDEVFRWYLIRQCDSNKNGILEEEEILSVTGLNLDAVDNDPEYVETYFKRYIVDMTGIEYFTNLESLNCYLQIDLVSLDLSKNPKLEYLNLNAARSLIELNVSKNTLLKELYCRVSKLTTLDLSNNKALVKLDCGASKQLKVLDVTHNTALENLTCDQCNLETLDLSKNTALKSLKCDLNNLITLDISKCLDLKTLVCNGNQLTLLNISANTKLENVWCNNNQLTALDVSKNSALVILDCSSNKITALDISRCPVLYRLECQNNQLTELILGNNENLEHLDCSSNLLKSVNIDGCPKLTEANFIHDDFSATVKQPEFTTHALVLSGQIGAFFYADLPEIYGVDYSSAYMTFDSNGDTTSNNPQMFDPEVMNAKGTYYGFVCYVSSVQMADIITATLHYGNNLTVEHNYSVKEYLDTIIEKTASESMRELAKAMKDYGHYMQVYLARKNGWEIGVKHEAMDYANIYTDDDIEEIRQRVSDYSIVRDTGNSGIEKVTFALELDSETIIDVYLKPKDDYVGIVEAYLDDSSENIATLQSDGRYLIQIDGVSAHLLGNTYTIHVNAGENFDVKVSALSYVSSILNASSSAKDIKEAVASLYDYYDATMAYRQSIGQ